MATTVADLASANGSRRFTDRRFKYLLISPAMLLLLLIGLFPLVYSLIVSFQHITMMAEDTSFSGFVNYAQLFQRRAPVGARSATPRSSP